MGKRPARPSGHEVGPASAREYASYVAALFRQAGFKVKLTSPARDGGVDFIAERTDGLLFHHRLAVEVKAYSQRSVTAESVRQLAGVIQLSKDITKGVLVGGSFTRQAMDVAAGSPSLQLITIQELEEEFSKGRRQAPEARTVIGKAILSNQAQIALTSAALVALVDERIAAIRNERPNSREAIDENEKRIEDYERLKRDVTAVAEAAAKYKEGVISEREAVKSSKSLLEGIQGWWKKSHEKICDRAFDMSLFATAVSILFDGWCRRKGGCGRVGRSCWW